MRWTVAAVFAYFLLAIEAVLPAELRLGARNAAPSFLLPFVVFIAMFAPPMTTYWAAILIGLAIDLTTPRGEGMVIAGPYALGFLAAAFLVVTIRTVINRNTVALAVFSVMAAALAHLVIVAIFSARAVYSPSSVMAWQPAAELGSRMLSALYTGLSGALMGLVLFPCQRLFKFPDPYSRRSGFSK